MNIFNSDVGKKPAIQGFINSILSFLYQNLNRFSYLYFICYILYLFFIKIEFTNKKYTIYSFIKTVYDLFCQSFTFRYGILQSVVKQLGGDPSCLSELTPMISNMELTPLGSKASN